MKVKVVRATVDNWYKVGEEYDVESKTRHRDGRDYYPLVDDANVGIGPEHCEIIEEKSKFPFKVRCINNDESPLMFGGIYEVTGVYADKDYLIYGWNGTWRKDRFEVVEEDFAVESNKQQTEEYTGSSVSYYTVPVDKPTDPDKEPYVAECNDIIEALGMNYAEGNAFKAIWRSCAARKLGVAKKGYDDGLYDAQKVVFFGARMVAMAVKG